MDYLSIFILSINAYLLFTFMQMLYAISITERMERAWAVLPSSLEDLYVWPNGNWCERSDFDEYFSHMSDDFTVISVYSLRHDWFMQSVS